MLTHKPITRHLRQVFLQLPLFTKAEDACRDDLDKWIYILKHMEAVQRLPFESQRAIFAKLGSVAEIHAMSEPDRSRYMEDLRIFRDNIAIHKAAIEDGRKEGIAEGIAEGRAEGRKEGRAEGELNMARKMKAGGIAPELIMQMAGITKEQFDAL